MNQTDHGYSRNRQATCLICPALCTVHTELSPLTPVPVLVHIAAKSSLTGRGIIMANEKNGK